MLLRAEEQDDRVIWVVVEQHRPAVRPGQQNAPRPS